jgi:hypothetical protein
VYIVIRILTKPVIVGHANKVIIKLKVKTIKKCRMNISGAISPCMAYVISLKQLYIVVNDMEKSWIFKTMQILYQRGASHRR